MDPTALSTALYDEYLAHVGLLAALPGGLHNAEAPAYEVEMPYGVFHIISDVRTGICSNDHVWQERVRFNLFSEIESPSEVFLAKRQLDLCFSDTALAFPVIAGWNYVHLHTYPESSTWSQDPHGVWQYTVDFMVYVQEA